MPAWTGVEARRLYPGWRCKGTFDVSGGWYDAGDYGKYVTSGGIAVWQLLSTLDLLRRSDSSLPIREFADLIRRECRWQLDWLMRMQVPPGDPLSGLAFHRVHGTQWSPMPGWAHEDPTERVLHRPSTAATLHLAAVAAKGARLFHATDPAYTRTLLHAARTAYQAARRHPHLIAPDDHARFGGGPYADDELEDDFYWAAVELWLTTDEEFYRQEVLSSALHMADAFDPAGFDFDRVTAVGQLDLALAGRHLVDHDRVVETLQRGADRLLELQRHQPWGQPYAPTDGWHWGSNGRILNNLVVLAVAQLVSGGSPMQMPSPPGWTTCLGETLSVRATSPGTAPTTAAISGLASSAMTSIRRSRHHHRAHWPVGRILGRLRTFPTILACLDFHRSAVTSMNPPPRSPMTSAFAGMHLWFGSPPT